MGEIVRVLRTVKSDLTSYNEFKYPKSGYVECPDWIPTTGCGYGLHGITKDINGYSISNQYGDKNIKWMVLEVDSNDIIPIDNEKVKFKCGNIIYCGTDAEKAILMVFDNLEDYFNADPFAIEYISNPDKYVQLAAVNNSGYAIQFIKNPDKDVQLAAVNQNGYNIQYINNPDKEVQIAAVQNLKK